MATRASTKRSAQLASPENTNDVDTSEGQSDTVKVDASLNPIDDNFETHFNEHATRTAFVRDAARRLGRCSGEIPELTLKWLRALDEQTAARKTIAIESADGPLKSFLREEMTHDWKTIKNRIACKFISADFCGRQLRILRCFKQRADECIASYEHSFQVLVEEAGLEPDDAIRYYLEGLRDRKTALAVIRRLGQLPCTFTEARDAVSAESAIDDFLPTDEIVVKDTILSRSRGKIAGVESDDQVDRLLKGLTAALAEVKLPSEKTNKRLVNTGGSTRKPMSSYECFRCGVSGHIARNCRQNVKQSRSPRQSPSSKTARNCNRCHRPGHDHQECAAASPPWPCGRCQQVGHWAFDCRQKQGNGPLRQ